MERKSVMLRKNATIAGIDRIARIECASGLVWITGSGSSEDVILRAGEARELPRTKGICVQALRESEIGIIGEGRRPLFPGRRKSRGR